MSYKGTITDINIFPTVSPVASILRFTAELDPDCEEIVFEDKGSKEDLSNKYGFKIEGEVYHLHPLQGKKCTIAKDAEGYHFVSYVD